MTSSAPPVEAATILASHRRRLRSERIGETFQIDVALPSVEMAKGPLPVVYVTDGNTMFGIAAQALRHMRSAGETRPALVVGIGYCLDDIERPRNAHGALRTRDLTPTHDQSYLDRVSASRRGRPPPVSIRPTGGAEDFLDFLVQDLRPFIAGLYETEPREQILVGSSLGGLFTLHAMLTRPGSFRRYVASSPSLWWDSRWLMGRLDGFGQHLGTREVEVFLSAGGLETQAPRLIAANMTEFADALRRMSLPNLHVTHHVFEGETHTSVIPAALSRGMRTVLAPTRA